MKPVSQDSKPLNTRFLIRSLKEVLNLARSSSSDWRSLEGLTYLVLHGNWTWRYTGACPISYFLNPPFFRYGWPTIGWSQSRRKNNSSCYRLRRACHLGRRNRSYVLILLIQLGFAVGRVPGPSPCHCYSKGRPKIHSPPVESQSKSIDFGMTRKMKCFRKEGKKITVLSTNTLLIQCSGLASTSENKPVIRASND